MIASFLFGARYGVYQSMLMNSSVEASLLTGELEALRENKNHLLIPAKEAELDGLILLHGTYLDTATPWIFWPESIGFENARYMNKVIKYKSMHPTASEDANKQNEIQKVLKYYENDV